MSALGERIFKPTDSDFPMSPKLQAHLRAQGRVDDSAAPRAAAQPAIPLRATTPTRKSGPPALPIPDGPNVPLGLTERGALHIDLGRLLGGRCLIQGSSGAGKSATLRRIVEHASRHLAVIVVDPEGEFANLAEHIKALTIRGSEVATDGLTAIGLKARSYQLSVHLDLSDIEPDVRIAKAAAFFAGLLAAPREDWANTVMVAVDEAHLLAPHLAASSRDAETRRLGVATLTDLCARGRKRGIGTVIATQRLAKLAASVVSELHNLLLGLNIFDRDVARAGDLLGYSYDRAAVLRDLKPGQFYALGPALCSLPQLVTVGPTVTKHVGATPELRAAADMAPAEARTLLALDDYAERGGAAARGQMGRGGAARALDSFLLDPASADAARVLAALRPISPNATTVAALAQHLGLTDDAVQAALDLLANVGAVDTTPHGAAGRIARLSARLRVKLTDVHVTALA